MLHLFRGSAPVAPLIVAAIAQPAFAERADRDKPLQIEASRMSIDDAKKIQVLEGDNAILKNRDLMGATDPKKAAPGTIRADFADSIDANAVHGSDAPETAAVEIAFFFAGMNVYSR